MQLTVLFCVKCFFLEYCKLKLKTEYWKHGQNDKTCLTNCEQLNWKFFLVIMLKKILMDYVSGCVDYANKINM